MERKRDIILALAVLVFAALTVSGRSATEEPGLRRGPDSSARNLYVCGKGVCDREGNEAGTGYMVDEKGNITDSSGNTIVAAEDAEVFTCVKSVYYDREQLGMNLEAAISQGGETGGEGRIITKAKTILFTMTAEPKDCVNASLLLESADPGALYFPFESNREYAENTGKPEGSILPTLTVRADSRNRVRFAVTAALDGITEVTVKNVLGETVGTIRFTVTASIGETGNGSPHHVHSFSTKVVDPTYSSQGYTLHTCMVCGYAYRDSYTEKLPHSHDWEDRVIPPTYTSGGYTLHICRICGATGRDTETPALKCAHTKMRETVFPPTCTEDGYTLHECLTCRTYSRQDGFIPRTGHIWGTDMVIREASCTEKGRIRHTCTVCGETEEAETERTPHCFMEETVLPTYTERGFTRHFCAFCGFETERTDFTPVLPHTHCYLETRIEPTCTESGYAIHTCTLCGDSYTDQKTEAYGHDYTESLVIAPGCTEGGITAFTCRRCGHRYESAVQALGHAYTIRTVEASAELPGYTEYRCSRCGSAFRNSCTP